MLIFTYFIYSDNYFRVYILNHEMGIHLIFESRSLKCIEISNNNS
jgi:hypothetical protein